MLLDSEFSVRRPSCNVFQAREKQLETRREDLIPRDLPCAVPSLRSEGTGSDQLRRGADDSEVARGFVGRLRKLQEPEALALDAAGVVYVSTQGRIIVKLSPSGAVMAQWGTSGTPRFKDPSGLALGANDVLYVTEYMGNRVDLLTSDGKLISTWK